MQRADNEKTGKGNRAEDSVARETGSSRETYFLSPHFDDAVLSCGGLISRMAAAGHDVTVATCYSDLLPDVELPDLQRKNAIQEARKLEDIDSLELLGVKPLWMGYTERFFREPWLRNPLHVFHTPEEEGPDGFPNLEPLSKWVADLLRRHPDARIYAPFGIGNHFDHVELFLAALYGAWSVSALDRCLFYEDGYAMGTHLRKRHFVCGKQCWKLTTSPSWLNPKLFAISRTISRNIRGRSMRDYIPDELRNLPWDFGVESLVGHTEIKLEAFSRYKSQVQALGGKWMLWRGLGKYHRFWRGEPYWTADRAARYRRSDAQ